MFFLRSLFRVFTVSLCVVYTVTNCAFAHKPEANFWAERKKALQFAAAVPLLDQNGNRFSPSSNFSRFSTGIPSVEELIPRNKNRKFASVLSYLPLKYGTVKKITRPASSLTGPTIIHIQDIHSNPEAQSNIFHIVSELVGSGKIDLVGVEGAFTPIDLNGFRFHPHQDTIRDVAGTLFQEGKISGPVYAYLTSPWVDALALRKEKGGIPPLIGIDDPLHYQRNVEAFLKSRVDVDIYLKEIAALDKKLAEAKASVFNPRLAAFDERVQRYHSGSLSLGEYLRFLAHHQTRLSLEVKTYLEALDLESKLNWGRVESERRNLIENLADRLTSRETSDLMQMSLAYQGKQVGLGDFYGFLKRFCEKKGVPLTSYPAVNSYIQYVLLSESISGEIIFRQLRTMKEATYSALTNTPAEKELIAASRKLYLMRKLGDFSLSKEEWEEYRHLQSVSPCPHVSLSPFQADKESGGQGDGGRAVLAPFESFYEEADIRDRAMAANFLKALVEKKATVAVLITGGFHSSGISEILKNTGAVTITVTPRVEKIDAESGSGALSVFTQEKMPLEKLFEGEKLFLAPRPINPGATAAVCVGIDMLRNHVIPQEAGRDFESLSRIADHDVHGFLRDGAAWVSATTGKLVAQIRVRLLGGEIKVDAPELPYSQQGIDKTGLSLGLISSLWRPLINWANRQSEIHGRRWVPYVVAFLCGALEELFFSGVLVLGGSWLLHQAGLNLIAGFFITSFISGYLFDRWHRNEVVKLRHGLLERAWASKKERRTIFLLSLFLRVLFLSLGVWCQYGHLGLPRAIEIIMFCHAFFNGVLAPWFNLALGMGSGDDGPMEGGNEADARALDPRDPSFDIERWYVEKIFFSPIIQNSDAGHLSGAQVFAFLHESIEPLDPDFVRRVSVGLPDVFGKTQIINLFGDINEQVLLPRGLMIQVPPDGRGMAVGRVLTVTDLVTPAGRTIKYYTVRTLKDGVWKRVHDHVGVVGSFGAGIGQANYVVRAVEADDFYLENLRLCQNARRTMGPGGLANYLKDPRNFTPVILMNLIDGKPLETGVEIMREADLWEEAAHSDTHAYIRDLLGQEPDDDDPEYLTRKAKGILRPNTSLTNGLDATLARRPEMLAGYVAGMLEVEAKLKALSLSPDPAYTFSEFIDTALSFPEGADQMAIEYRIANGFLLTALGEYILPGNPEIFDPDLWIEFLREHLLDIPQLNEILRVAAQSIYHQHFLSRYERSAKIVAVKLQKADASPDEGHVQSPIKARWAFLLKWVEEHVHAGMARLLRKNATITVTASEAYVEVPFVARHPVHWATFWIAISAPLFWILAALLITLTWGSLLGCQLAGYKLGGILLVASLVLVIFGVPSWIMTIQHIRTKNEANSDLNRARYVLQIRLPWLRWLFGEPFNPPVGNKLYSPRRKRTAAEMSDLEKKLAAVMVGRVPKKGFEGWESLKTQLQSVVHNIPPEPGFSHIPFLTLFEAARSLGWVTGNDQSWDRRASSLDLWERIKDAVNPHITGPFKTWAEVKEFLDAHRSEIEVANDRAIMATGRHTGNHHEHLSLTSIVSALEEGGVLEKGGANWTRVSGSYDLWKRIENTVRSKVFTPFATWPELKKFLIENKEEIERANSATMTTRESASSEEYHLSFASLLDAFIEGGLVVEKSSSWRWGAGSLDLFHRLMPYVKKHPLPEEEEWPAFRSWYLTHHVPLSRANAKALHHEDHLLSATYVGQALMEGGQIPRPLFAKITIRGGFLNYVLKERVGLLRQLEDVFHDPHDVPRSWDHLFRVLAQRFGGLPIASEKVRIDNIAALRRAYENGHEEIKDACRVSGVGYKTAVGLWDYVTLKKSFSPRVFSGDKAGLKILVEEFLSFEEARDIVSRHGIRISAPNEVPPEPDASPAVATKNWDFVGEKVVPQREYPRELVEQLRQDGQRSGPPAVQIIADLGMGVGNAAIWLAQQSPYFRVIGVVKDRAQVLEAAKLVREKGLPLLIGGQGDVLSALRSETESSIALRVADVAQGLPFPDTSLEGIVLHGVYNSLRTFRERDALVKEIGRVLKPGGVVSFVDDLWVEHGEIEWDWYEQRYNLSRELIPQLVSRGFLPPVYSELLADPDYQFVVFFSNVHNQEIDETIYYPDELLTKVQQGELHVRNVGVHERKARVKAIFRKNNISVVREWTIQISENGVREGHQRVLKGISFKKSEFVPPATRFVPGAVSKPQREGNQPPLGMMPFFGGWYKRVRAREAEGDVRWITSMKIAVVGGFLEEVVWRPLLIELPVLLLQHFLNWPFSTLIQFKILLVLVYAILFATLFHWRIFVGREDEPRSGFLWSERGILFFLAMIWGILSMIPNFAGTIIGPSFSVLLIHRLTYLCIGLLHASHNHNAILSGGVIALAGAPAGSSRSAQIADTISSQVPIESRDIGHLGEMVGDHKKTQSLNKIGLNVWEIQSLQALEALRNVLTALKNTPELLSTQVFVLVVDLNNISTWEDLDLRKRITKLRSEYPGKIQVVSREAAFNSEGRIDLSSTMTAAFDSQGEKWEYVAHALISRSLDLDLFAASDRWSENKFIQIGLNRVALSDLQVRVYFLDLVNRLVQSLSLVNNLGETFKRLKAASLATKTSA